MRNKIAFNGFGRIGRMLFRQIIASDQYQIVGINDVMPQDMLVYLLKYDSAQGAFPHQVSLTGNNILQIADQSIPLYREAQPQALPWAALGVNTVIDCSGAYNSRDKALTHLAAGAQKVLLSAPAGNDVPTVVFGVNEQILSPKDQIISAASCSTNALAPIVYALHKNYGILSGIMTVVHSYTATQTLVDAPQKKGNLRRSRAAAVNMIPTTAEAAVAVGRVIPELQGKLSGSAVRVPVPAGCFINFVATTQSMITEETINEALRDSISDVIGYTEEELVSSDIVGMTTASLFDATQTIVNKANNEVFQFRVGIWFDNETSFASQMGRLLKFLSRAG